LPEVLIPAELEGIKGKIEVIMLANSGSDYVILPKNIADKIKPKIFKREAKFKVAGGKTVKGNLCLVKIRVKDPESNEERCEEVEAVILGGQDEPLAGISALERLGILLDMKKGKYRFT